MEVITIATPIIKENLINEQIRAKELRVISAENDQLGIMLYKDAQKMAYEQELDLVLIAETANPPVAKIMDYKKFKYEQTKKQKELKKNQKIVELKELRFTANIDTNDMNTKAKHGNRFLADGDKLRVSIRLRGREMARPEAAIKVLLEFYELLKENGTIEKEPKLEGRTVSLVVTPIAKK